jgi:hypothetical protein
VTNIPPPSNQNQGLPKLTYKVGKNMLLKTLLNKWAVSSMSNKPLHRVLSLVERLKGSKTRHKLVVIKKKANNN